MVIKNALLNLLAACFNEGSLRLTAMHDDQSASSGQVKICQQHFWRAVCGHDWSDEDAAVVCRQLGFLSWEAFSQEQLSAAANDTSPSPESKEIVWWRIEKRCVGNEDLLVLCDVDSFRRESSVSLNECVDPFSPAFVNCTTPFHRLQGVLMYKVTLFKVCKAAPTCMLVVSSLPANHHFSRQ